MRLAFATALLLALPAVASAVEFTATFRWGNIPLCTTGWPGKVPSPEFVLNGLPGGVTTVEFRLKDLDVPTFKHGGGKLKISGNGKVPAGAFKYLSPCPPSGQHTYEWSVTARKGNQIVARTVTRRKYPE